LDPCFGPRGSTNAGWRRWKTPDEETSEQEEADGQEATAEPARSGPAPETGSSRKVAELTDDLVRLQAEFENYRKRVDRESAQRTNTGTVKVVADLLPLLDAFDKALEDAKANGDAASLRRGMEILHRQLIQILKGLGLREVRADGMLDPFEHEAMMRQETDAAEDGKVLEVFQKGYALGPKVIRTAKVKVAKAPEPQITDHDTPESEEQEEEKEED